MTTSEQEDKEVQESLTEPFRGEAAEDYKRYISNLVAGTDRLSREIRGES